MKKSLEDLKDTKKSEMDIGLKKSWQKSKNFEWRQITIFLSYSEHWFLFSYPDNTPIISGRTWCGICFRLSKQYDEESDVINKNSLRQMVIGLHSKSGRYDIPHLEYSVLNITFYNDSGQVILLQINKYSTKKLTLLFWRWDLWLDEILEDLKSSCNFSM